MPLPFGPSPTPINDGATTPLGMAAKGFRGTIRAVDASACTDKSSLSSGELERRLVEMGFVEGSTVEIKHEGFWGRDPIVVRLNNTTIALHRRAANGILVCPLPREPRTKK